jgi:hypothetical protein
LREVASELGVAVSCLIAMGLQGGLLGRVWDQRSSDHGFDGDSR